MGCAVTIIHWSGPALRDLEAALDYIAKDNREAADRLAEAVYIAVSRLKRFPASGRMVPELEDPNLREIIHSPFRVIDQERGNAVDLLAAIRAEQDLDLVDILSRSV